MYMGKNGNLSKKKEETQAKSEKKVWKGAWDE